MVEKPDAGDIIAQKKIEIAFEDDVYTLYMKMTEAARQLDEGNPADACRREFCRGLPRQARRHILAGANRKTDLFHGRRMPFPSIISHGPLLIHTPARLPVWAGKNSLSGRPVPEDDTGNGAPGKIVSIPSAEGCYGKGIIKTSPGTTGRGRRNGWRRICITSQHRK